MDTVGTHFKCACKLMEGFLNENTKSEPCPICGRIYECTYNKESHTLDVKQVKKPSLLFALYDFIFN